MLRFPTFGRVLTARDCGLLGFGLGGLICLILLAMLCCGFLGLRLCGFGVGSA